MLNLLPLVLLTYFGIWLSIIDLKSHRLPNRVVGWFAAIEVSILGVMSIIDSDLRHLVWVLGVAIASVATYLILYLISRGSLGMGDVKFALPLGLCVGWYAPNYWLISIFLTFLLAGSIAALGIAFKHIDRKSRLAFGPFMFVGTFVVCGIAVLPQ